MKHIKNYKIFEGISDKLPKEDEYLNLLKDLSLEISDLDFRVKVSGYESYTRGYNTYDLTIESNDSFVVYDIDDKNINQLDSMNFEKINKLNESCKDLIKRSIDNGLYLCSYEINTKNDGVWCFIRFTNRQDGNPVGPEYKYYDEDEIY